MALRGSSHQCGSISSSVGSSSPWLSGVDHGHDLGIAARVLDQLVEPAVYVAAGLEHQRRLGDCAHVAGPGLVVVWIGVRAEDAVHVDPVAAHVPDEVGHVGGRRDHGQLGAAGPGIVVAAAGGPGDDRHNASDGERTSENDSHYH
jgi:hypothetical protein